LKQSTLYNIFSIKPSIGIDDLVNELLIVMKLMYLKLDQLDSVIKFNKKILKLSLLREIFILP